MADPFVIYTMGDTSLFMAALNGIAMIFNNSDLFSGNGYLGLGFGAFFGASVLLLIMIYNAAFKKQMELKILLLPLILYMILTGPKVDVALQDIYGRDSVKRVDNIPIGLAIPATVASGISVVLTRVFETAYSVVTNNSYNTPKITEDGYVTPLKLINALRSASTYVGSSSLLETTKNVYNACIINNTAFNSEAYSKSENPIQYLAQAAAQGNGLVYIVQDPATANPNVNNLVSCAKAGEVLAKAMDAYMDGSNGPQAIEYSIIGDVGKYNLQSAINGQMISNGSASGSSPNGRGGLNGYQYQDVVGALSSVVGMGESSSRNFIAATLLNPYMQTASYCSSSSSDMNAMSKCTAWVSSQNQWEEKNAASATGFLKVMQNGQNLLIMISFLFFPIIVIIVMVQGAGSLKMLGNYMAFTVSAYMWIPMACLINFYIQHTLADEYYKIIVTNGINNLTLFTAPQFYAAVSQKLALANGFLAAIPVLCMMLFSGMMVGMNQLTSRMNPADGNNYDAKVNTPDIHKSAPLSTTSSAINISGQGVASETGLVKLTGSSSSAYSAAQSRSQAMSNAANQVAADTHALQRAMTATSGHAVTTTGTVSNSASSTQANTQSTNSIVNDGSINSTTAGTGEAYTVKADKNTSQTESKGKIGTLGAEGSISPSKSPDTKNNANNKAGGDKAKNPILDVNAGVKAGGTGVYADNKSASSIIGTSDLESANTNTSIGNQHAKTDSNVVAKSNDSSTAQMISNARATADSKEVNDAASQSNDISFLQQKLKSSLSAYDQVAKNTASMDLAVSGNEAEIVGTLNRNGGVQKMTDAINASPDAANKWEKINNGDYSTPSLKNNPEADKTMSMYRALSDSDEAKERNVPIALLNPAAAQQFQKSDDSFKGHHVEAPNTASIDQMNNDVQSKISQSAKLSPQPMTHQAVQPAPKLAPQSVKISPPMEQPKNSVPVTPPQAIANNNGEQVRLANMAVRKEMNEIIGRK